MAIRPRSIATSRRARLWAALHEQSQGRKTELDADLLCRTATPLLDVAAVAVSVPDHAGALRTVGAAGPNARALADTLDAPSDRHRWPLFTAACNQAGVVTVCALPLQLGAARCGVLALYLTDATRRTADLLDDAEGFADLALELVLVNLTSGPSTGTDAPPEAFLSDHPEVHHATGMTSVQLDVDLGTAVVRLRERAVADGRPLLDLAADIVAGTVKFEHEPSVALPGSHGALKPCGCESARGVPCG
jgi:hypothetical protein